MTDGTAADLVAMDAESFRFDPDELEGLMRRLQTDLTDLKQVDLALQPIAERESGSSGWQRWKAPAKAEVILGQKYPFTVEVEWSEVANWGFSDKDRLEDDLTQATEGAGRWALGEVAVANGIISNLRYPEYSDSYETFDQELDVITRRIQNIEGNFGKLRFLEAWRGDAADAFETEFYEPFGEVRERQCRLADRLRSVLHRSRGIVHVGQYSLMNVLTATSEAVDDQLRLRSQGDYGESSSTKQTLSVVSASAAVAAVFTAPVAPLSAALVATSAVAGLGALLTPLRKGSCRRPPSRARPLMPCPTPCWTSSG